MELATSILYSLFVLFLLTSIYYYLGYRSLRKEWSQQVRRWYPEEQRKSFISKWGDKFDENESSQKLRTKLQSANLGLLPSEYIGILVLGSLTIFVALYSVFSMPMRISFILAVGIITAAHFILFYIRKNAFENRFNEQLSEVCRILGNAAKSGLTINQGVEIVAKEVSAPAGEEFKRISNELKLGVSLEMALRSVQKRNKSRDFNLFIATLLIQKKTGGNLAKTLETMAETFEARKVLAQTVKTMTSEQRYISFIVPGMPIILLLLMNNVIDGFIDPLWSGFGIIILLLFLGVITISFILIRKITDIKV